MEIQEAHWPDWLQNMLKLKRQIDPETSTFPGAITIFLLPSSITILLLPAAASRTDRKWATDLAEQAGTKSFHQTVYFFIGTKRKEPH